LAIGTAKLGLSRVASPNRRRLIAAQERLRCWWTAGVNHCVSL